MKLSAGSLFTIVGGGVAIFGVVAMTIGLKFSVPPEVLTVIVYKGIFAAGAGFMIVGAWLGRRANQKRREAEFEERHASLIESHINDIAPSPDAKTQAAERIYRERG